MKSHAVYLGPTPPSSSSGQSGPHGNNEHNKRSVFERLGRQLHETRPSTGPPGSIRKRLAEPMGGHQTDPWSSISGDSRLHGPQNKYQRRHEMNLEHPNFIHTPSSAHFMPGSHPGSIGFVDPNIGDANTFGDSSLMLHNSAKRSKLSRNPNLNPSQALPDPTQIKAPKYDRHGNLIVSLKEKFRATNKPWDYGEGKSKANTVERRRRPGFDPDPDPDPDATTPSISSAGVARWRERRDVIISLDREVSAGNKSSATVTEPTINKSAGIKSEDRKVDNRDVKKKNASKSEIKRASRPQPEDMSDGEIIDDDDDEFVVADSNEQNELEQISDDDDFEHHLNSKLNSQDSISDLGTTDLVSAICDIADNEQRTNENSLDNRKHQDEISEDDGGETVKDQSEIELLNALGIDWANLVEMAHSQSAAARSATVKKSCSSPGGSSSAGSNTNSNCSRSRFLAVNYLRTITIPENLAGPYLTDKIKLLCYGAATKAPACRVSERFDDENQDTEDTDLGDTDIGNVYSELPDTELSMTRDDFNSEIPSSLCSDQHELSINSPIQS